MERVCLNIRKIYFITERYCSILQMVKVRIFSAHNISLMLASEKTDDPALRDECFGCFDINLAYSSLSFIFRFIFLIMPINL